MLDKIEVRKFLDTIFYGYRWRCNVQT